MRRRERRLRALARRPGEFIASQLLGDELVERLVGVQRPDDAVAIFVGVAARRIRVAVAIGIGVARDIEPVAAPALTVIRRVEQPIDQLFVSIGRSVCEEGFGLRRRRRQTGKIKMRAAQQSDFFRIG